MSQSNVDKDQEELEKLLKIAREKRAKVIKYHVWPLKELCLMKVADSDECAKTSILPYQYLSPLLQKEILKHMATKQGSKYYERQTPAMSEWMFELANRLLNCNSKEFDFRIFGGYDWLDHEQDQRMWQILIDRCPNLESILDERDARHHNDSVYLSNVMPYLQKFRELKHILLKKYVSNSDDLTQLAQHFPNLESLSTTFQFIDLQTMQNLYLLQNLIKLDVNLDVFNFKNRLVIDKQKEFVNHFKAECTQYLPRLQYCSGGWGQHNSLSYRGNRRQLALRDMETYGGFDLVLAPCLETLSVLGPFDVKNHVLGVLSNLTVLSLLEVDASDVPDLLTHYGNKLHELYIYLPLDL
ncbi:uncharacterized protein LOC132192571 [Neocloeon triangulifer]|uniref:uncharacterized protein LOC132192571 n=1 Tax=Neocloeon triangulifer TaxID=2078957 RepID=UPI00286ED67F|nr:uncharacterized protein LOC132192571 [Neocloeon triangulifer]XP_059468574.1 uncharacterized protein LOC132192571 [Neocloeon triangulifer]